MRRPILSWRSWWLQPSADDASCSPTEKTAYPAQMDEDLQALGEDLITTAARVLRWVPKENNFSISLAAARLLARLHDNGPTRISDLALAERCSQPTITNHVKRLEAAHLVDRAPDPRDARAWMIKLTKKGYQQLSAMRASIGTTLEPYLASMSKRDLKALRDGVEAMRRLMAVEMEKQRS
jgi:DNA-binding MarR family transcriptional regulator